MSSLTFLTVTFDRHANLCICVRMTGDHHVFKTGKYGYQFREHFDWDGRSWLLRYQAFVRPDRSDTTLGVLRDVFAPDDVQVREPAHDSTPMERKVAEFAARARQRQKGQGAGWHLKRVGDGVQGWFKRGSATPKNGKLRSFASFYVELNGSLHLGQFYLSERFPSTDKPIAWDYSKGAKAGLPSLGKRK